MLVLVLGHNKSICLSIELGKYNNPEYKMCHKIHILPAVALAMLMISSGASAQVTILAANGNAITGDRTFTPAELNGFDPAGADKLVVTTVHNNGGGPVSSITYNGESMTLVRAEQNDNPNRGNFSVWYLDFAGAAAQGDLVYTTGGDTTMTITVIAMSNTVAGYAVQDAVWGESLDLDPLFDGSAAVACFGTRGNDVTATWQTPSLTTAFVDNALSYTKGGGAYGIVNSGTNTFSAELTGGNDTIIVVSFPAVGADTLAPEIISSSAVDDASNPSTSISTDPVLNFTFNEPIYTGTGSILLKESGGATVGTYDVTSASELSFGLKSLTITPDVLDPDTSYYVQIPSGAIEDGSGNTTNYPDTTLEFTTAPWKTASYYFTGGGEQSSSALRGFDPTGYDKLVVIVMGENDNATGAKWGASSDMIMVTNNANGIEKVWMWYLDGPFSGPDTLTISGTIDGCGVSLLALSGTDPGVAAFGNANSASIDFTTTSDESFVVAGYTVNGGSNPYGVAPFYTYLSRNTGSSNGASAVTPNSTIGSKTFSFAGNVTTPSLVIAEFTITPPPAGTVILVR